MESRNQYYTETGEEDEDSDEEVDNCQEGKEDFEKETGRLSKTEQLKEILRRLMEFKR